MERLYPVYDNVSFVWQTGSNARVSEEQTRLSVKQKKEERKKEEQVKLELTREMEERKKEIEIEAEVAKLRMIDVKVRAHELAHSTTGGQYAGAPHYQFVVGPDGKLYAVAGEVPIDVSPEDTPEKTIRKMEQVIAAALAPADPSPQDVQVAAIAAKILEEAILELSREKAEQQNRKSLAEVNK